MNMQMKGRASTNRAYAIRIAEWMQLPRADCSKSTTRVHEVMTVVFQAERSERRRKKVQAVVRGYGPDKEASGYMHSLPEHEETA